MVRYTYKKAVDALRNEGPIALMQRTQRRTRYSLNRLFNPARIHAGKWAGLKGRFAGNRVFLVGNGPSLNQLPLHLLRDEYTMCANRFYLMLERLNWRPRFYMAVDNLVLNDMLADIDDLLSISEYVFMPDIHLNGEHYYRRIGDRRNAYWLNQVYGRGFSTRLPRVHSGGTVIGDGLQVLNYLGFSEIYLIGVDMNFRIHETARPLKGRQTDIISMDDDDPNHFDPRYFGKGRSYHQPAPYVVNSIIETMNYIASVEDIGATIRNAGLNSRLKCFPKVKFESLFDVSADVEEHLFNECFRTNTRYDSVAEFEVVATEIERLDVWDSDVGDVHTRAEIGTRFVATSVFSHVPLGPYRGRYYFVKRSA